MQLVVTDERFNAGCEAHAVQHAAARCTRLNRVSLRSGQSRLFPKQIEQRHARLDLNL
jgi:hypothetical protein